MWPSSYETTGRHSVVPSSELQSVTVASPRFGARRDKRLRRDNLRVTSKNYEIHAINGDTTIGLYNFTGTLSRMLEIVLLLLYFRPTVRMPCSSETSIQWLLRLVVDVAVSNCQRTV